jgi:GNAT superfamily N-acetyltransferase
MELRAVPPRAPVFTGPEQVAWERLDRAAYLDLYGRVGRPLRWDQRLRMPPDELEALLASDALRVYVLRDADGVAIGLCEFDRTAFPEIELKNFGLVPAAQGRGLGPRFLGIALAAEWRRGPTRVWLHTDEWDHPAAVRTYERAGFRTFDVRYQAADPL